MFGRMLFSAVPWLVQRTLLASDIYSKSNRFSTRGLRRCLYWTHFGHITKTVTAENSVLDVFNFSPGAVAEGTAHRKLADLHNSSAAALCECRGVVNFIEGLLPAASAYSASGLLPNGH